VNIRTGTVQEAAELARRIPDFSNPYNLNSPDAVLPKLDHVLIAEQDGVPVGFRAGYRYSPDTFAIWLAGVLPEYRRQGIGGQLYREQKEWLKSQGYRYVRTHVRNSNRVMLKIFVDNGYHVVDVVRYPDTQRNKVVFVKNLWDEDSQLNAAALIVGLLKSPLRVGDPDLQARLRDFTISWLRFKYLGRIIEDSSVNAILDRASESGHQYCLIVMHPTIVSHAWELGLVKTIEAWAGGHDFFVAGNILQAEDSCCGISAQTLLVNLEYYRKLSRPEFGEPGASPVEVSLPQPAPTVRGENGAEQSWQPSGRWAHLRPRQPGWNFASASLAAGIPVWSLPEAIAATFLDIAPESDQQAERLKDVLGNGIATAALDPAALSAGQFKFLSGVQRQVQNSRRGIFVWNFESYDDVNESPADFISPISTLYSVAAGLKTSWILETHGFDEKTRLVYFDYSRQALDFKKLLHDAWNGEDYPEFLRYLFEKIPPGEAFYQLWGGFSPQDMAWDKVREAWTREISRWGGEAVIKKNWRRAKDLRVEYVLCNILDDQGPLAEKLDDRPGSVIWWSNVFFTFYSNWFYTIDQRRAIYERFLRSLTERSPQILVYGNDYNNVPVNAIPAAEYSSVYFQTDENYLEPRKIRG
jgi:ribosomal protein S18 acetylase RimI-like enzyme